MNRKVIIASDSTCDLSPELIKEYDVKIIPLYINFENESYKEIFGLHPEEEKWMKITELFRLSSNYEKLEAIILTENIMCQRMED